MTKIFMNDIHIEAPTEAECDTKHEALLLLLRPQVGVVKVENVESDTIAEPEVEGEEI